MTKKYIIIGKTDLFYKSMGAVRKFYRSYVYKRQTEHVRKFS